MFILEMIFDGIIDGWFELMQWIIPDKAIGKYTRIVIKILVGAFSLLIFISILLGVFAVISADETTRQIGKYMILIPLCISAVQIALGIIIRLIRKKH